MLLVVGGGYYFFIVQAQAAVPSPAALLVITTPVDVDTNNSAGFHTGRPGQELTAGNSVRTGEGGHAAIQFPDGSYVRMAPSTTVTLTAAQLSHDGNLQSASLVQRVGRTFTNVQHLVGGASFQVGGHSVSAAVRGTQFELLVRADNTNLIKVFDGTVKVSGTTTATLTAGQQIDADANGRLSGQGPIKPEAARSLLADHDVHARCLLRHHGRHCADIDRRHHHHRPDSRNRLSLPRRHRDRCSVLPGKLDDCDHHGSQGCKAHLTSGQSAGPAQFQRTAWTVSGSRPRRGRA